RNMNEPAGELLHLQPTRRKLDDAIDRDVRVSAQGNRDPQKLHRAIVPEMRDVLERGEVAPQLPPGRGLLRGLRVRGDSVERWKWSVLAPRHALRADGQDVQQVADGLLGRGAFRLRWQSELVLEREAKANALDGVEPERVQGRIEPDGRHSLPGHLAEHIEEAGQPRVINGRQRVRLVTSPSIQNRKLALEQAGAAQGALQFSACGLRDGSRTYQNDVRDPYALFFGEGVSDKVSYLRETRGLRCASHGCNDHQGLALRGLDGKCATGIGSKFGRGSACGMFQVLRIMVFAVQNDQVLDPAGDVQFTTVQESEVAGAQVTQGFAGKGQAVRQRCITTGVVAFAYAGTGDDDFADLAIAKEVVTGWREDADVVSVELAARTDEAPAILRRGRLANASPA